MRKITIAGGTGFLGQSLETFFSKKGDKFLSLLETLKKKIISNGMLNI